MTTPSLLIYIPSYNRYDRLCEQLDNIVPHMDTQPIYVIISDNASTDERYYGLKIKYPYNKLTVIHNVTNLGANPNIFNGFIHAMDYDYVWILSDDDTIRPDAIYRIMQRLDNKIDLIYLMLDKSSEIQTMYNIDDLIKNTQYGLGLISGAIIRTEPIKESIKVGYEYISSGFPHLAILFSACINNKLLSVLEYPVYYVLKNKIMDQPVETKLAYVQSIYGYVTLADFIQDDSIRYKFIHDYIFKDFNMWSVVEFKYRFPERYKNMLGYILIRSPILFCECIFVCAVMSVLRFIWNNVSVPNRNRLKSIIYTE